MKILPQRLKRSLPTRLLLVFLLTALISAAAIVAVVIHGFGSQWRGNVQPHLMQYLEYVNDDIGIPPDLHRAKELASELPINIYITGPNLDFSSTGQPLELINDEFYPRDSERRYIKRNRTGSPLLPDNVDFGSEDDRSILRNRVGEFTLYYELPHRKRRSGRDSFAGRALLLILALLALCYLWIRRMLRPVQDIKLAVSKMGQGELDYRVPIRADNDLGELASSINIMAEDIEQMLDAKQQLLLGVSHELRSPVTRAKIATQMLEDSINKTRLADDLAEMDSLITEILETERMNSGHAALHREKVSLTALVQSVVEEMGLSNITQDLPNNLPDIMLDEARIRLLLRNLLSNAERHGGDATPQPSISVTIDNDTATIEVRDHGSGIAEEHLEKVTEPFYRADPSRTRTTGGFGVGLYLCKQIAEAHNGTLDIQSKPDQGVRVSVTFALV